MLKFGKQPLFPFYDGNARGLWYFLPQYVVRQIKLCDDRIVV